MSTTKARRNYNGSDPTAAAVLSMQTLPPVDTSPVPPGGVTMTSAARRQAIAMGLRPYEIAGLQRQVAALSKRIYEDGALQVRTHKVCIAEQCGVFTITRVM